MRNTTAGIQAEIAKGVFRPHTALTNMALAYYQNASNYFEIGRASCRERVCQYV